MRLLASSFQLLAKYKNGTRGLKFDVVKGRGWRGGWSGRVIA